MARAKAAVALDLYETDYFLWTQAQAAELRRMQARGISTALDLERLAEEVEDLGKAERNAVRSQIRRIIEHCLKLEHSPAREPRGGWYESIVDARTELEDKLSPSLRRDLEDGLPKFYEQARRKADVALRARGENAAADALPPACPCALDDLLRDDWYPVNRHGIAG
jgi:hypothetical protein